MMLGLPSLRAHKALMEHDRAHGEPPAKLGAHFHWLRSWLSQRSRQWHSVDWIICGANPILGALACAAAARRGKTCLWLSSDEPDAWDYPLAMAGAHDDLLAAAGLPGMGPALFKALARECAGKARWGWGWRAQYCAKSAGDKEMAFLAPAQGERRGEARELAKAFARDAFAAAPTLVAKAMPSRVGKGPRGQIVEHSCSLWTSDRLDGKPRQQWAPEAEPGAAAAMAEERDMRVGRARWHAQEPIKFALESRRDVEMLLKLGGWT